MLFREPENRGPDGVEKSKQARMDLRENKGAEMATVSITRILRSFAKMEGQEMLLELEGEMTQAQVFLKVRKATAYRKANALGERGSCLSHVHMHTYTCTYAAAAAKSLQSSPTLCDPIGGSPPGSPDPGILQAKTVEWVALSFSNA